MCIKDLLVLEMATDNEVASVYPILFASGVRGCPNLMKDDGDHFCLSMNPDARLT